MCAYICAFVLKEMALSYMSITDHKITVNYCHITVICMNLYFSVHVIRLLVYST